MYKLRSSCRACNLGATQATLKQSTAAGDIYNTNSLIEVLDLGVQPLANDFTKSGEECAGFAPLRVNLCPRCYLGQLSVEIDPAILYAKRYSYVTSTSKTMQEHFNRLEKDISDRCVKRGTIVEIGSNDGLCLEYFIGCGWKTALGIDPAPNLNNACKARGIQSLPMFFDEKSALTAFRSVGNPHLILARHCFCHINDWKGFINALELLAGEQTTIAIEVPWAQNMLEQVEVDTIYHEHTSYLSLTSIEYLLRESHFCLDDVIDYDIHGGAVLLILKHRNAATQTRGKDRVGEEKIDLKMWRDFAQKAELNIIQLGAMVRNLVSQGKKVCGYGASAKSTVWVSACEFTKNEICFICDNTRWKQYTTSPGTDIPICDEGALIREIPDYAICFAWNFATEILSKEQLWRDKGGRWIMPRKKIEIV